MTRRRWATWTAAWTGGAVLAVANGALRELVLVPWLGDTAARQASTLTLMSLLGGYVWWLCRRWPLPTQTAALRVGGCWVLLTVGFEFGLGHYVEDKSWAVLLADYDITAGHIWLLVPIWILIAPAVMTWLQNRRRVGSQYRPGQRGLRPASTFAMLGTCLPDHTRRRAMSDEETPATTDDEMIAAASDGAYTLLVADFAETGTAWDAYELLKSMEDGRTIEIEGVVVVKRETDGQLEVQKATDHSTRSGLKWGVVGGIALGVIFPPSIIGSAAALGAAGAATGKVRQLHHRSELATELENSIAPGHSGIVALVSDPGVVEIRKALAKADAIVESAIDKVAARDIKAAAKDSSAED
jgi:uncharacterized membrane protein